MKLTPTDEQRIISHQASLGGSMIVRALAGTGKTTTLGMLADAHPARAVTYLAFNKEIATEAGDKMPSKVRARTVHACAYAAMKPDQERLSQRMNGFWVASRYDLSKIYIGNRKEMTSAMLGGMVLTTLSRFCNSADDVIGTHHVPSMDSVFEVVPADVRQDTATWYGLCEHIAMLAARLWESQVAMGSKTPLTHDTYLKQWVMGTPRIAGDLIMFDEAQDASPVILQLLDKQRQPIIWVGDEHQQIYAWRGAVNAMESVKADHEAYLSESFRFGPEIAGKATEMLRYLGESRSLIGSGDGQPKRNSSAYLCRTNATAIDRFMTFEKQNLRVELVGAKAMEQTVKQLGDLIKGHPTGAFFLFKDYSELVAHSKTEGGRDMAAMVKAVDEYGIDHLSERLQASMAVRAGTADVTLSTVHRAKGREWDYVEIAGDWSGDPDKNQPVSKEEARLMYVAVTRARVALDDSAMEPWTIMMAEQLENRVDDPVPPAVTVAVTTSAPALKAKSPTPETASKPHVADDVAKTKASIMSRLKELDDRQLQGVLDHLNSLPTLSEFDAA